MEDLTDIDVIDDETQPLPTPKPTYVVFDTETTGLFLSRDKETGETVPADDPRQPRMASFAYILADEAGEEISRGKHFIKPDGWSIDGTEAGKINGLTDAFLAENGVPVAEVLDLWTGFIDDGLIAAAFNAQFDCKMMRAELRRAERPDRFEETRNTCLMRGLAPYKNEGLCIVRGYVKLSEACEYFGIVNAAAHDAMADAEAALAILKRLIAANRVIAPQVHYAKEKAE